MVEKTVEKTMCAAAQTSVHDVAARTGRADQEAHSHSRVRPHLLLVLSIPHTAGMPPCHIYTPTSAYTKSLEPTPMWARLFAPQRSA